MKKDFLLEPDVRSALNLVFAGFPALDTKATRPLGRTIKYSICFAASILIDYVRRKPSTRATTIVASFLSSAFAAALLLPLSLSLCRLWGTVVTGFEADAHGQYVVSFNCVLQLYGLKQENSGTRCFVERKRSERKEGKSRNDGKLSGMICRLKKMSH